MLTSAAAMHDAGIPLMRRVLPARAARLWRHYPRRGIVTGASASRFFYHCHPPGARCGAEHGHFHLFVGKHAMPGEAAPLIAPPAAVPRRGDVVHLAALSIDAAGLPLRWFTVNRWVTGEWLYPAAAVAAASSGFDLRGARGDPLVNAWLTAMLHVSRDMIGGLLVQRDAALAAAGGDGEDRSVEVLSSAEVDLAALLDGP